MTEKILTSFFFCCFCFRLVLNVFYREGPMVYFNENYNFPRLQWGPSFSRGIQLYPGGSNF